MAKKKGRGRSRRQPQDHPAAGQPPAPISPQPPAGPLPHETSSKPPEIRHADERIEHPQVHYEKRDVRFHWVMAVIVAAICIISLQSYFVWLFFLDREQHQRAVKASRFPLAPAPTLKLPAEPRLEPLDRVAGIESPNVAGRELSRERMLARYGPAQEKGYIHVPIERAMEQVIAGLPVRKQPQQGPAKDTGLLDAGESNSGRIFRGQPR